MAIRTRKDGFSWSELKTLIPASLDAGVATVVFGSPGLGKSALACALADKYKLPLVDIRLAQQEPGDLAGVYFPDKDRERLQLLPPGWVQDLVESPAFLFLDEINAAVSPLHQSVAYQMVLERRLGPYVFHPETVILAAGNLEEDDALTTPLSSALSNRFAQYRMRVDSDGWLDWARSEGVHTSIIAYVARHGSGVLYDRKPGEAAFPSPRSWSMASRVMERLPKQHARHGVAACVGQPAASKSMQFLKLYRRVSPEKILGKGHQLDFTQGKQAEASFVHAAVYSVADWLNHEGDLDDNQLSHVTRFLRSPGLDPEYCMLFLRQIAPRKDILRRLRVQPEFRKLASELVDLHAYLAQ